MDRNPMESYHPPEDTPDISEVSSATPKPAPEKSTPTFAERLKAMKERIAQNDKAVREKHLDPVERALAKEMEDI